MALASLCLNYNTDSDNESDKGSEEGEIKIAPIIAPIIKPKLEPKLSNPSSNQQAVTKTNNSPNSNQKNTTNTPSSPPPSNQQRKQRQHQNQRNQHQPQPKSNDPAFNTIKKPSNEPSKTQKQAQIEIQRREKALDESICRMCCQKAFKYRCPACALKTCSLKCSNDHKNFICCPGIRDRSTRFKTTRMYSETDLDHDVTFMNKVTFDKEGLRKDTHVKHNDRKINQELSLKVSQKRQKLKASLEKERGIKLQLAPPVLAMAKNNRTHFNKTDGVFLWTIQWVFPSLKNKRFLTHDNRETITIKRAIELFSDPTQALDNELKAELSKICRFDLKNLSVFVECRYLKKFRDWFKKSDDDGELEVDRQTIMKNLDKLYKIKLDHLLKDILDQFDCIHEIPQFLVVPPGGLSQLASRIIEDESDNEEEDSESD